MNKVEQDPEPEHVVAPEQDVYDSDTDDADERPEGQELPHQQQQEQIQTVEYFSKNCQICGYNFDEMKRLAKHLSLFHQKVQIYLCELCGFQTRKEEVHREHLKCVHDEVVSEPPPQMEMVTDFGDLVNDPRGQSSAAAASPTHVVSATSNSITAPMNTTAPESPSIVTPPSTPARTWASTASDSPASEAPSSNVTPSEASTTATEGSSPMASTSTSSETHKCTLCEFIAPSRAVLLVHGNGIHGIPHPQMVNIVDDIEFDEMICRNPRIAPKPNHFPPNERNVPGDNIKIAQGTHPKQIYPQQGPYVQYGYVIVDPRHRLDGNPQNPLIFHPTPTPILGVPQAQNTQQHDQQISVILPHYSQPYLPQQQPSRPQGQMQQQRSQIPVPQSLEQRRGQQTRVLLPKAQSFGQQPPSRSVLKPGASVLRRRHRGQFRSGQTKSRLQELVTPSKWPRGMPSYSKNGPVVPLEADPNADTQTDANNNETQPQQPERPPVEAMNESNEYHQLSTPDNQIGDDVAKALDEFLEHCDERDSANDKGNKTRALSKSLATPPTSPLNPMTSPTATTNVPSSPISLTSDETFAFWNFLDSQPESFEDLVRSANV